METLFNFIYITGGSAIAIALLVLLNVILGGAGARRFTSLADGLSAVENAVLGFEPSAHASLVSNGAGLLVIETGGRRLGLALWYGDRPVIRALHPGDIQSIERDGACLVLTLDDYTFPQARVRFEDRHEQDIWAERLAMFDQGARE